MFNRAEDHQTSDNRKAKHQKPLVPEPELFCRNTASSLLGHLHISQLSTKTQNRLLGILHADQVHDGCGEPSPNGEKKILRKPFQLPRAVFGTVGRRTRAQSLELCQKITCGEYH